MQNETNECLRMHGILLISPKLYYWLIQKSTVFSVYFSEAMTIRVSSGQSKPRNQPGYLQARMKRKVSDKRRSFHFITASIVSMQ